MSFLKSLKDKAVSFGAEKFIGSKFERYGEMLDLKIDSSEKNIHAKIILRGEEEPLSIAIKSYKLITHNGEEYLEFGELSTSKEWMNILAADFLKDNRIKLPDMPGIVKMLL